MNYRPLKVLHVITRLDKGGSSKVLLGLTEGLKARGLDVVIITGESLEPEESIDGFREMTGIPIHIIPELKREISLKKDLSTLFALIKAIKRESPDILHTHTSKAGILGRLAGRLCRVRNIIHTPHGHIFYGYFGRIRTWFFFQIERLASHLCDRIITITSLEKRDYIRLKVAKEDKLIPIHCGINLKEYVESDSESIDIKRELMIDQTTLLIGWVGRLEAVKGCFDFLDACKMAEKDFPMARFLMVGDGALRKEIEAEVRKGTLNNKFFILGYRKDIPRIMKGIDIFCLTSLNEGLGIVLIEAMAAGKAVIATDVGGVSEVILDGKTGILVPPGNPEAVAIAIKRLLSDTGLRSSLGRAGRERARLFDREEMIEKTLSLYEELIGIKGH